MAQVKVTYRNEKEIADLKENNDLLYVINGEITPDKFVLLAESTKAGTLNIHVGALSYVKTFHLDPLKVTRIEFPIKNLKSGSDLNYEFKFIPEGKNPRGIFDNYGTGRFTIPPKDGETWTNDPKIAIISFNDVAHDFTEDLKLENEKTDIKFLLGDQIYGDDVAFPMIGWDEKHVWANTDNLTFNDMKNRYDEIYRLTYHLCQTSLRNGMNIMMPDDHETYNDSGVPCYYDFSDKDRLNAMKASYKSFIEHQLQLRSNFDQTKPIDESDIYLHRKWGDIEYIGIDTRFDRFPAIWKKEIFNKDGQYEAEPTWISREQTTAINNVIENLKSSNPKYLIVSTPTQLCSTREFLLKMSQKYSSDYVECYNNPRSKEEFYKLLTKLFEASKKTNVLTINRDVHQSLINSLENKNNDHFCELTSSPISSQSNNSANVGHLSFYQLMSLYTIFKGKGVNDYTAHLNSMTSGNNVMFAELCNDKVKTTTYCAGPVGYFESFLMQLGLKSFPEAVKDIHSEYNYKTGDITFVD